jgi:hypothetical protein
MADINHYSIDGGLNAGYGPTWVGTYSLSNVNNYVAPGSLTLKKEFAKGQTSFSNQTFPLERTSLYETITVPMEYVVKDPCSVNGYSRDIYLYKWYNVTIPGFPRATNLSVEGDKWSKMVNLSWEREIYDSDNCITDGTWVIFRKNLSNNTVENLGSTNFNTHKFTQNCTSEGCPQGRPWCVFMEVQVWQESFRRGKTKILGSGILFCSIFFVFLYSYRYAHFLNKLLINNTII